MNTWVVLLRGINVGGTGILPMKGLTLTLENADYTYITTYIQSGNVVLKSSIDSATTLKNHISETISESHGFKPRLTGWMN